MPVLTGGHSSLRTAPLLLVPFGPGTSGVCRVLAWHDSPPPLQQPTLLLLTLVINGEISASCIGPNPLYGWLTRVFTMPLPDWSNGQANAWVVSTGTGDSLPCSPAAAVPVKHPLQGGACVCWGRTDPGPRRECLNSVGPWSFHSGTYACVYSLMSVTLTSLFVHLQSICSFKKRSY